ncbi:quaternary ammonium compound efflux SMR transporter SugE [uncultured Bilophila sp.]|jgi:quaternary ammonium compound-resistance protein SugE|uniref:quaternary ammonium compound efflux SMR transporter SugE n=1 Tax=uncultured Bilophila sp. TaxID=529385 RepID=UPI0025F61773|nr:quaternary ammonium compound efflux SMR transporter SugE [uncultured Bilophila sp.]
MHWFLLVLAGLFEVGWAIGLKSSHGFTRLWPSVATLVLMSLSFFLLATALKHLPIGTAYAVWTGIGAVGTALLGIILFGESASPARLACIGLILAGIAGLKLLSDA